MIVINVNGQIRHLENTMQVSLYKSIDLGTGLEYRGNFDNWYMAFQFETFAKDDKQHLNWGGAIGFLKHFHNRTSIYGGGRIGFVKVENTSRPAYGLELEADLHVINSIYIGVRGTYDMYMDSTEFEVGSKNFSRVFMKIGYTF